MQFLDRDNDEEDGHGFDFLIVKQLDVFGLDLKQNQTFSKKESSQSSVKEKLTKVAEAKEVMKRNVKANKKITFTDEAVATDSKSASKDGEEEDDTRAKERYQEEDKFDKEEYKKKIKAKHQERQLKEREANKRQTKARDEDEAFPDWSDEDIGGFDQSTLPDPDKHRHSEDSESEDIKHMLNDTKKKQGIRKGITMK
ncbi:hypothetical protein ACRRTK_022774 [Alexandromys fortis]